MFVSVPSYRFPMPAGLAAPGVDYWRTLYTSVNSAWYILSLHVEEEGVARVLTLLFWWDSDVVDAIDELNPVKIESLICILPVTPNEGPTNGRSVAISEIWELDVSEEHCSHPLLIDDHGRERIGICADVLCGQVQRRRRIATIGEVRNASNASGA